MVDKKEFNFWNDKDMVGYFASKPADPVVIKRLEKVLKLSEKTALDLGCGGGRHSELLAEMGYRLTSIDINPEMLEYTKKRLLKKGLQADVLNMSIENLSFKPESFDVIVSTGVLHQVRSVGAYKTLLKNLVIMLKPGGLLTLNLFTNAVWDDTYAIPDSSEPYTVITKEGLYMTILPKELFYQIAEAAGFELEEEVSEDIKNENTGCRAVLRAHLTKA